MWTAIKKELAALFTLHRRTTAVMIFIPILYTLLFGSIFAPNIVTDAPIIVCNLDEGMKGQQLIRDFDDSMYVKVQQEISSDEKLAEQMDKAGASGAVVIPKNFSQVIARGEMTSVFLLVDNSSTLLGGSVQRGVREVVGTWDAQLLAKLQLANGWSYADTLQTLRLDTRLSGNATGGYEDFFLLSLVLHSLQIGIVFSLGPSMVLACKRCGREMAKQPWRSLLAKLLAFGMVALGTACICLGIILKSFALKMAAFSPWIVIILASYLLTMICFALMVGSWVSNPESAITAPLFYIMPSVLFTGAVWPRFAMDRISLLLSYIMPIGHVVEEMRALFVLGGSSITMNTLGHILVFWLLGACFIWIAKKGLERRRADVETLV